MAQRSRAQHFRREQAEQRVRGEDITEGFDGCYLHVHEYHAPKAPGLYAISVGVNAWEQFGLGPLATDRSPWVYVGKAERSIASRTLKTHFGYSYGCTGRSSFRRTLVALLRESLDLEVVPRTPLRPGDYDRYGLDTRDEWELGCWLNDHAVLVDWTWDGERRKTHPDLHQAERDAIAVLRPAFNLTNCRTPWTDTIRARRAECAASAREWAVSRGLHPGSSAWSDPPAA